VTYPPATGSPPHLHANGVLAFVVSGTVASKVGDGPERAFHADDAWWEPPGAIHRVSRNASSTEPATLLAIYVAPRSATTDDLMKPI
jgi:quercetin dioxygenase-like cupin family protein